jgi:AraC-like DNA-binding protein
MKPKLLDRSSTLNQAFELHHHQYDHFLRVWHYHPELELVYIKKSSGTRFLGDSIKKFQEGDLVLIGENLPHMWQNDNIYFEKDSGLTAEALVIHLNKDFAGKDFFRLSELVSIKDLFENAKRGVLFRGEIKTHVVRMVEEMLESSPFDRFIILLQLLKLLSTDTSVEILASPGFVDNFKKEENRRLDKIYDYIINNFKEEITLEKVADLAGMNISSFCRYFKKTTNKTFSHYLNEVRVGFACRLLIEQKYNISETCYSSGFNNISNFNRQFKIILNMSPSEYMKLHKKHQHADVPI